MLGETGLRMIVYKSIGGTDLRGTQNSENEIEMIRTCEKEEHICLMRRYEKLTIIGLKKKSGKLIHNLGEVIIIR